MRTIAAALVLVIAGLAAATAQRRQPTLLPPFEVTTLDGLPMSSGELAMEGSWLLVYVGPDCSPCEQILRVTGSASHPEIGLRTIVIHAGASASQLKAIAEQFPGVPSAAWHRDPHLRAVDGLQIIRLPAVVGVRNRSIEWTLAGVLLDASTLESLMTNWLAR